jgi:hypothetical protein
VTYQLSSGETALNAVGNQYACDAREADLLASRQIALINNGTIIRGFRNQKSYPANQCYYQTDDPSILKFGNMNDPNTGRGLGIAGTFRHSILLLTGQQPFINLTLFLFLIVQVPFLQVSVPCCLFQEPSARSASAVATESIPVEPIPAVCYCNYARFCTDMSPCIKPSSTVKVAVNFWTTA